jgi:hypothetical protein
VTEPGGSAVSQPIAPQLVGDDDPWKPIADASALNEGTKLDPIHSFSPGHASSVVVAAVPLSDPNRCP